GSALYGLSKSFDLNYIYTCQHSITSFSPLTRKQQSASETTIYASQLLCSGSIFMPNDNKFALLIKIQE
ncbi:MAG: hypothetical protein ABFD18_15630, partial [Syntrophomonas sp.]